MIGYYKIITVTHHFFPVEEIGSYVVQYQENDQLASKLESLKSKFGIEELQYMATCNRATYILYTPAEIDYEFLKEFFRFINPRLNPAQIMRLDELVSVYEGLEAIRHLFEVAGSIDSLVVGEREIFRQYRESYENSKAMNLLGDRLRLLEKQAVLTAKKIYANTRIGEKPLSVVSLATRALLDENVPSDAHICFIGAGQTNTLMAKLLKKAGNFRFSVFNRSIENAQKLADYLKGEAYTLDALLEFKKPVDVFIVTTSATEPVLTKEIFNSIPKPSAKIQVVDLSVPQNVDQLVIEDPRTNYIYIDQLKALAEKNLNFRKQEVAIAKEIVKNETQSFVKLYQQRQIEVALQHIPDEIRSAKEKALQVVYKDKVDQLDGPALQVLHEILDYFEKKCVAIPIKAAKSIDLP